MQKCNPDNERIKRAYFEWQKEANQKNQTTIDHLRKAIHRYEEYTKFQDFKTFNKQKAIGFKKKLAETNAILSGEPISKSTLLSTFRHLKDFFKWLAYQRNYRTIDINEIEYFNLSEKETRIAQTEKRHRAPTIEQIRKAIEIMPGVTEIDQRNRAIIAFALLTGIRDGAIASLKLKHVKLSEKVVEQIGGEVKTKFSKTIYTFFLPVGADIEKIVADWINYLIKEKLYNADDPLFPRTKLALDSDNHFTASGLEPVCWQSANQIRQIFKHAFENAGLEYFSPHSFRDTLVHLGETLCQTPEEFKAWSQNLGHEKVLTTFNSYGTISEHRQSEIISNLGRNRPDAEKEKMREMVKIVLAETNKTL